MNKMARSNRENAVLPVQLAHERAWQPRGGLNEDAFKRLGLLERLEAENASFPKNSIRSRSASCSPRLGQSMIIEKRPGGGKSYLAPSRNAWIWSMRSTTLSRS